MILRILHIIDDNKFIDYCKGTYEINDYHNTYQRYNEVDPKTLRETFDVIVIHFLRVEYKELFNESTFPINRIVWTMWGADSFSLGGFFNRHLLPKTKNARLRASFTKSKIFGLKIGFKSLFPRLFDLQPRNKQLVGLIKKINNVVVLVPQDANELSDNYETSARFYHINYVDPVLQTESPQFEFNAGDNILLGNSSAFTNNHLDCLQLLDKRKLGDLKLLVPLNYGDELYGDIVEAYVNDNFGSSSVVPRKFMPFIDYLDLLSTCEIALMPHIRQQAIGNIVKLLLQGTHIYFHERSGVYKFLKENGFYISSLNELDAIGKLSLSQKEKNQQLALEYFGKSLIHKKVTQMLNEITSSASMQ